MTGVVRWYGTTTQHECNVINTLSSSNGVTGVDNSDRHINVMEFVPHRIDSLLGDVNSAVDVKRQDICLAFTAASDCTVLFNCVFCLNARIVFTIFAPFVFCLCDVVAQLLIDMQQGLCSSALSLFLCDWKADNFGFNEQWQLRLFDVDSIQVRFFFNIFFKKKMYIIINFVLIYRFIQV